jgi:SET domain-containing protein
MTIFIDVSPGKGLGMFASKDFKKGEIIEVCPVIELSPKDSDVIDKTLLSNYNFMWGKGGRGGAICLGYGSIYNHSHEPNAEFETDEANRRMVFSAKKDIKKGEEIFIDYDWDLEENTPDWFRQGKAAPRKD